MNTFATKIRRETNIIDRCISYKKNIASKVKLCYKKNCFHKSC